jgi:pimeloyl-ACP methyl ester carboxylesterase
MHDVRDAEAGGIAGMPAGPPARLLLTEPARGLADFGMLFAAPWLGRAQRGDGHGVLVLPGFLATDTSTGVLRRFLRMLGYNVRGWEIGRNVGPTERVLDQLPRAVIALANWTGGPVSVIGWSLGGIYARELARQDPGRVRQVITLGSPFALGDSRQSHADGLYRRRSHLHASARVPPPDEVMRPIPVPSTAVYSRRDGIVAWQACIEPPTELHDNVEVRCSHLGFGVDSSTLWLIADRLALPAGVQPRFSPPRGKRHLYPGR